MKNPHIIRFLVVSSIALAFPLGAQALSEDSLRDTQRHIESVADAEEPLRPPVAGLNLTPEQQADLEDRYREHVARLRASAGFLARTCADLTALASEPEFNAVEAARLAEAGASAMMELADLRNEARRYLGVAHGGEIAEGNA